MTCDRCGQPCPGAMCSHCRLADRVEDETWREQQGSLWDCPACGATTRGQTCGSCGRDNPEADT